MLVGILAPNSVGMMGRINELLCKGRKQGDELSQAVNNGEKREHRGYLHGGCVCHSLLRHSGCGLGDDASGGLGFNRQMALAGGGPSTCTRCHTKETHTLQLSDQWVAVPHTPPASSRMNR